MPNIPAIPDKTGGAGNGSFNIENTTPTIAPVNKAIMISVIRPPFG